MNLLWIRRKKLYSQEELKKLFNYTMTSKELKKIEKLNMADMLSILIDGKNQIKYIKGIGYIWISEGYLILEDGSEPVHYFCKFYNSSSEIKKEIIEIYKQRVK